jgi:hypothetical protein
MTALAAIAGVLIGAGLVAAVLAHPGFVVLAFIGTALTVAATVAEYRR